MTCSRRFDRLLQVACLGLVGILAGAGCGGSSKSNVDAKPAPDSAVLIPDAAAIIPDGPVVPVGGLTVDKPTVTFGSVDEGVNPAPTLTVIVTNTGLPVAASPSVTPGTGFAVQGTTCTGVLGTNASCTITIAFGPAVGAASAASATLTIGTGTGAITVTLSGNVTRAGTFAAYIPLPPTTALVNQAVPFTVAVAPAGPLTDLSCLISGPDIAADATATTCQAIASASCSFGFIFKAAKAGPATDSIACSSSGKVVSLPVSVNVLSPASLTISPTPMSFGGVVNATGDPITFKVRNNGTASSGSVSVVLGGTGAAQFSITDNQCSGVLLGGGTCTVAVVYAPTTPGTVTASLTATDAAAPSTPAVAALTGIAVTQGTLTLTGTLDLGSATVGLATAPAIYTLTNSGGSATDLVTIGLTDAVQFTIGTDLCTGTQLQAGKICTFTVAFTPATDGLKSTVLTAKDGTTVATQLTIKGTGVAPIKPAALSISPPSLTFLTTGVGNQVGPQTFVITNTGGTATGVLSVAETDNLASGGAAQFSHTDTCKSALAPGATCTVSVIFAPTIPGNASASFTVGDGTVFSPAGGASGTAVNRPAVSFTCGDSPYYVVSDRTGAKETFADTAIGKTATVACIAVNDPNSPQETGAITITPSGDFAVPAATNSCTTSLLPGRSCTFALTFTPTAMGQRNGGLTLTTANQGTRNQDLSGVGLGLIEIVEVKACPSNLPATSRCILPASGSHDPNAPIANLVSQEPYDFGQVTQTGLSTTTLTLAVYVRAAVGNLSIVKDFGSPDSFVFRPMSEAPGLAPTPGPVDCDDYKSTTTPTDPLTGAGPLCFKLVKFNPQFRTPLNGTVTISGAAGQTDSATMTGTGTGPITISPSPATFSNVGIGMASTTMTLTVTNNGVTQIDKMAYTLTGANADQFQVVEDTLSTQSIGTAILGVKYVPTTAGGAAATITVSGTLHNGAGTESQTVSLLGNGAKGTAMTVTIDKGGVFDDTAAGGISQPLTVTVTNASGAFTTGNVTLGLTGGDFRIVVTQAPLPAGTVQGTCQATGSTVDLLNNKLGGTPVTGGSTCTYLVWFTPGAASAAPGRTGTLLVTASPGGSFTLPLSGNATPQLTISTSGPVAGLVDIGTAIIGGTTPSVMFTVTNHGATDIGPTDLTISQDTTPRIPNNTGLFIVDSAGTNSGPNGCNKASGVTKAGGSCTFLLSAVALSSDQLGTAFSRMLVQRATPYKAQTAQVDVQAEVVTNALLQFTPATDFYPAGCSGLSCARDLGVVELGTGSHSATVKYTVVNVGGVNSGPITAAMYLHTPLTDRSTEFSVDNTSAGTCGNLYEAGLPPGSTCDLLVTFTPSTDDTAATTYGADLVAHADPGLHNSELRRYVVAEVTSSAAASYLADYSTGLAPSDMGLPVSGVYTATLALHAVGAPVTLTSGGTLGLASVTSSDAGDTLSMLGIVGGATSPCIVGTTLPKGQLCTLKLTYTPTGASAAGWHVFTVTTTDGEQMNVFARIPGLANLVASRGTTSGDPVQFGEILSGALSAQETVVITNTGEARTANLSVTSSPTITANGCGGSPLAYMGTCTLLIKVQPTGPGSDTGTITVAGGVGVLEVVNVAWTGAGSSLLTRAPGTTQDYDFGSQAVLSKPIWPVAPAVTPVNPMTFTFQNATGSLKTGPLAIAVLNGTAVVPDFVIDSAHSSCVNTCSLGLDSASADCASCTVVVQFIPTALATPAKTGTLTVIAGAGGTAGTATVLMTGKAVADLSVTAAGPGTFATATDLTKSLDVGSISISNATGIPSIVVTFTNEANAPQTGLLSVALSGQNASDFLVTDDNQCIAAQLAGGGSCTIKMTFLPKAAGARTATLTVSGSPGDSATLTLNGTGTSP